MDLQLELPHADKHALAENGLRLVNTINLVTQCIPFLEFICRTATPDSCIATILAACYRVCNNSLQNEHWVRLTLSLTSTKSPSSGSLCDLELVALFDETLVRGLLETAPADNALRARPGDLD